MNSRSRAVCVLLAAQNPDGGWGYRGGGSWTEPTVYALLALKPEASAAECVASGARWLFGLQRPDGGWPPRASVSRSTWVAALALLVLPREGDPAPRERAVKWLLGQSGRESDFFRRLRVRLFGAKSEQETRHEGWPWYPGTAAWVTPTALSILALEKATNQGRADGVSRRLESARRFLWSRVCRDGGWNHGSTRAFGYVSDSYPETTGTALLALHGAKAPGLGPALASAERHLRSCRSSEAVSWLRLGLSAHSKSLPDTPLEEPPCRGVMDSALWLLADRAMRESNPFLE